MGDTATGAERGAVRLALIDGFDLICDGNTVFLPQSAQRLVAFLALHERPVDRAYVAGTLWLDKSEVRACANLRSALWRVNQTGLDLVETSARRIGLRRTVSVDVWEALIAARDAVARSEARAVGGAQIALLRGDLLPDWYDDWVLVERERLRQLRLHALEAMCERLVAEQRAAQAIEAGLAAVAAEPMRESAHRVLILAHLAEGNHSEAVRQYQTFADLLWENLGLRPSPRMEDLMTATQRA